MNSTRSPATKEVAIPFKSEKQRRWMHANHPEMAARWERETKRRRKRERKSKRRKH